MVALGCALSVASADEYELVLRGGRVLDPETRLDALRDIGIRGGRIAAISTSRLAGRETVDVAGMTIAPGFIDLHQHANQPNDYQLKVQDGVTTVGELEVGVVDVDAWYSAREGRTPVNFAVSVGQVPARMMIMGDRPAFLPDATGGAATRVATAEQRAEMCRLIERGLERGAVAVGFGLQYTPSASELETIEIYRVAARFQASCHVHLRAKGETGPRNLYTSLAELISATAISGAATHVCHVQSISNRATPRMLELISDARSRGMDISVECYPYGAGMTEIQSAIFDDGWQERTGIGFAELQWPETGERLTAESFARYRQRGGLVILHANPESIVEHAVAHPLTFIASDGLRGHPRHAGTSARVLGLYSRERKLIPLMQAVEKLSLMPARRLEARVPAMKRKGRIQLGADADLVVFDPQRVIDRATYEQPDLPSAGIPHVIVAGVFVVRDSQLQENATPGKPVRAEIR